MTTRKAQKMRLGKASTSVQGSSGSSPSGIRNSINPFHIPEIRFEIGRYLDNSALARCSRVCREWNRTFIPFLYSALEITKKASTVPSMEALRNNEASIKSISFMTDKLYQMHSHLMMPNLETLTMRLYCSCPNMEPMVRNHKSIRFLELSAIPDDNRVMMWKAIASLPHIEELTLRNQGVDLTSALWDAISCLKKLSFNTVYFRGSDADTRTLPLRPDFDVLRDLTITYQGYNDAFGATFIMKCPNLERLEWETFRSDINAKMTPHVQNFIQGLVGGKWANMKSLSIRHRSVQDAAFAEIIQALGNRILEELDVSKTQFGQNAFGALERYFSTLRILNIRNCPNLNSANVMELLTSCPHLQNLTVGRIYAQYLDTDQIWPCSKTLQSLSIEFELDREPNSSESSGATERTPEELNEVVFVCLGRLRELRNLTVGYLKPELYYAPTYVRYSIPLEIQLPKGLGALVGLKRLNSFSIGALMGSLGPKEVDWMINNWPQLEVLEGLSKTTKKIPRQRVAKRNGIKVK